MNQLSSKEMTTPRVNQANKLTNTEFRTNRTTKSTTILSEKRQIMTIKIIQRRFSSEFILSTTNTDNKNRRCVIIICWYKFWTRPPVWLHLFLDQLRRNTVATVLPPMLKRSFYYFTITVCRGLMCAVMILPT